MTMPPPNAAPPPIAAPTDDPEPQDDPLARYFANLPAEEMAQESLTRQRAYWTRIESRGMPHLWRLIYAQAFGMDPNTRRNATQQLVFAGVNQNFVRFRMQLTRSLVKQRNTLAAGDRIGLQCLAMNNDAASLAQVPIASKALESVFREARGEHACNKALESDGFMGEGLVWARWDSAGGAMVPKVDVATGAKSQVKSGACSYQWLYPWDVFREPFTRSEDWIGINEPVSKWELIAKYPEHAEWIEASGISMQTMPWAMSLFTWDMSSVTDDMVIVTHIIHRATGAVPNGRYIGHLNGRPLWDEPKCPTDDELPVARMCSAEYFGTMLGYPESSDLLSVQEMIDEILSMTATNILRFGNQNLFGTDGLDFDIDKFMEGGAYFTIKEGQEPPKVVEYASMDPAAKWLLEWLIERMPEMIGSNDTMRGNPSANISSGAFAALMQQIAEKYLSATQEAYDYAVNKLANVTLKLIRANAENGFIARVSGQTNLAYMQFFTQQELRGVQSVQVVRQTALMNSIPGRFDVFTATRDLPKDQRYAAVQLLKTGDDSAWTEDDYSELVLIAQENESLQKGQPVPVNVTDDPILHNLSHKALLARLRTQLLAGTDQKSAQMTAMAIQMLEQHIGQHPVVWAQCDPTFAQTCGLPQPPMFNPALGQFGGGGQSPTAGPKQQPAPKAPLQLPPPPHDEGAPPGGPGVKGGIPKPAEPAEPAQAPAHA